MAIKYHYNESVFEKINTAEKAYWLGFLYADGNNLIKTKTTKSNQWRVSLTLQKKDGAHVVRFKEFMCSDKRKEITIRKDGAVSTSISNKKISLDLVSLGLVPRKSLTITFPSPVLVPNALLVYFIQGLFDGDGSVSMTTKTRTPCACLDFTGSVSLIQSLQKVLNRETGIRFGYKERKHFNTIAVTYIKGNDIVLKFMGWLYKDPRFVLPRKYQRFLDIKIIKQKVIDNKSSKYRGVYMKRNYPHVQIQIGSKVYRLGRFKTEDDAARAYNAKAIELFGENAKLNNID